MGIWLQQSEIKWQNIRLDAAKIDTPDKSCENGCAFLAETWGAGSGPGNAPLQLQVQNMFADLADIFPENRGGRQLMAESLLAYYIPFRSPSISALPRKSESRTFGRLLWTDILSTIDPGLIITMDKDSFADITVIIEASRGQQRSQLFKSEAGWGNISAELARFEGVGGRKPVSVLRFPHLSRFRIFGRPKSKLYTDTLFRRAVHAL